MGGHKDKSMAGRIPCRKKRMGSASGVVWVTGGLEYAENPPKLTLYLFARTTVIKSVIKSQAFDQAWDGRFILISGERGAG
jgi:hypothetical protein